VEGRSGQWRNAPFLPALHISFAEKRKWSYCPEGHLCAFSMQMETSALKKCQTGIVPCNKSHIRIAIGGNT
jgi:hypothetical protein